MAYDLKPFVLNIDDIAFLLDQVSLRPLFDADGNLVFNWGGDTAVWATSAGAAGGPALYDPATGGLTPAEAVAAYGHSFYSVADAGGVRDVSGLGNNLDPANTDWGAADVPFLNVGTAGDLGYGTYVQGDMTNPLYNSANDYTITGSGSVINIADVVDYTPRMITQTIATAGVRILLDADGHIVYWDPDLYNHDDIYKALIDAAGIDTGKLIAGAAVVNTHQDVIGTYNAGLYAYGKLMEAYGITQPGEFAIIDLPGLDAQVPFIQDAVDMVALIETNGIDPAALNDGESIVAAGDLPYGLLQALGVQDTQNPDNGEYFIETQNPGVAPTNGFFAVFGQFFDHGLDFVGKGASGTTITIPLSPDDPLYGVIGRDGQPTTSMRISRANVDTVDENGVPLYINHTSPFIDQSQTYGSHEQITEILREWVEDPNNPGSYIAGARLLDGHETVAWTDGFGVETTMTLPTLNELRAHIEATGRAALTWEDVLNLRQRDATGQLLDTDDLTAGVQTAGSGHAMLLDMNPGFSMLVSNGTATSGHIQQSALDALNAANGVTAGQEYFVSFSANGQLQTEGHPELSGVGALAPYISFSNFSIMGHLTEAQHDAVSEILMQSVGDHYVAGDGRVNENVALTSIHHVFHMEHTYQAQNLGIALFQQDALEGAGDHATLHDWQVEVLTGGGTSANAMVADVNGHWEATGGVLARDAENDFYVVDATTLAGDLPAGHSLVMGRDGAPVNAAGAYTDAAGFVAWDQDRMFEAVKLVVEMEYQHTAVDQYARAVTPDIPEFSAYATDTDGTVNMFYSQGAFRFGHSTLRETIDTLDPNGDMTGRVMSYALEQAFLNPGLFADLGATSIVMGMTRQVMNDIDEFVTPALQQGLLGLPLDLAAINIARGRDVGLPTLNHAREQLGLTVYTSWNEFAQNMYHQESLVNFIAAYSFDGDVAAAQAVLDGAAAGSAADIAFLNGGDQGFQQIDFWMGGIAEVHISGGLLGETFNVVFVDQIQRLMDGDRFYYLYRLAGTQFGDEIINEQFKDMVERTTGATHLNGNIFGYADQYYELDAAPVATERLYDIAGPGAEVLPTVAAGEALDVDAGPFYDANGVQYIVIPRDIATGTATVDLWTSPNGDHANAPAVAIGARIEIGATYLDATGAVADLTANAAEQHHYGQILAANPGMGIYTNAGFTTDGNGQVVTINGVQYVLDQRPDLAPDTLNTDGTPTSGAASNEVVAGTDNDDLIYLGFGDDTGYGDGGNDIIYGGSGGDRIYGGAGNDTLYGEDLPDVIDGGDGDDIIYGGDSGSSVGGFDQLIGGAGNDLIHGGVGIDKIFGNSGDDAIYGDGDTDPFMFGGDGNDIVDGGGEQDNLYGNAGDDLVIGGADKDILFGQEGDDILRPGVPTGSMNPGGGNTGNAVFGPDEVVGGDGNANNPDTGFDLVDLSDNQQAYQLEINLGQQNNPLVILDQNKVIPTMFQMDGIVGTQGGDTLLGDGTGNWLIGGTGDDDFEADQPIRNGDPLTEVLANRAGNDVIIGGSVRLDTLIGKYGTGDVNSFVADDYATYYGLIGANHRVSEAASLVGGLLSGTATSSYFDSHFTEMLRSRQFRDLVLGDDAGDTAGTGGTDTVHFSGNFEDYTVLAVDVHGNPVANPQDNLGLVFGIRVTDNGNPQRAATDGTDLIVGVENFAFADGSTHSLQEMIGYPPTLALDYDAVEGDYRDNFNSRSFSNSDGGTNWVTDWIETGDNNSPNNGQIVIDDGGASSNRMAFGAGNGAAIERMVDLAGADSATISFNAQESGFDNGEFVTVTFAADGVNFETVAVLDGSTGFNGGVNNLALTGPFTDHGVVRFEVTNVSSFNEFIAIDNLVIDFQSAPTAIYTDIADTFTENGPDVTIAPKPLIDDLDGSTISSAKVVLTNAKDGDNLVWSNINGNFDINRDTSVAGQITVTLTSNNPASFADFAAQLDNIRFTNNSGNPDTTPRIVETTVNDGRLDSAPATTTIDVVSVQDPAQANNDTVVSNSTSFEIPEWALMANDVDPEGDPFSITDTYNDNGVSVSQPNGTSISVSNTGGSQDRFDYHVTGGNSARVNVDFDTFGTLSGNNGSDIVIGDGASSNIDAGQGDDIVLAGGGNDNIVWFANAFGNTDGRDFVDGGDGTDTFIVNGRNGSETFRILTAAAAVLEGVVLTNAATEIVVMRNGEVIAELDNIEELVVNSLEVTANNGNGVLDGGPVGGDLVEIVGDFSGTSLAYSTIHVNGSGADDTVDISALASDHRVVFTTGGGDDELQGGQRPQDQIIEPEDEDEEEEEHAPMTVRGTTHRDLLSAGEGDDVVLASKGNDRVVSGDGDDRVFAGHGNDVVFAGDGDDWVFGGLGKGNDRIFAGEGDDVIIGGRGHDTVFAGEGDDVIRATKGDGNDVYYGDRANGDDGNDTLDMSRIASNALVDLGTGADGRGSAHSAQSGHDVLWDIENVVTGAGNDVIIASDAVNVIDGGAGNDIFRFGSAAAADGDTLVSFQPGDRIDLSGIDADEGVAGDQSFTLVSDGFTGAGQLMVSEQSRDGETITVIEGNTDDDGDAEFTIEIRGAHVLTSGDFNL
jgi:Animal haem peroxidase/RTX calcium-binding nonapeptide repeat (4 copies)